MSPAATAPASRFSALAQRCVANYRALICDSVEGKEIDPDDALQIARDAGRSALQMDADLQLASERYDEWRTHHAVDWSADIANAVAERLAAQVANETAQAAFEAARKAATDAYRAYDAAAGKVNRLTNGQTDGLRELGNSLRLTGDRNDWKQFNVN